MQYVPRVTLLLKIPCKEEQFNGAGFQKNKIFEGSDLFLECDVDANPMDGINYPWYLNNDLFILDFDSKKTVLRNVNRNLNGSIIKCVASNQMGTSANTERLIIVHRPQSIHRPTKFIHAEEGETLLLECQVDAYSLPSVIWFHNDSAIQNVSQNNVFNLQVYVTKETVGKYLCMVTNGCNPPIEAVTYIQLKNKLPTVFQYRLQNLSHLKIELRSSGIPEYLPLQSYYLLVYQIIFVYILMKFTSYFFV